MRLSKPVGNILTKSDRDMIPNPQEGVEIDYYYKATRFGGKTSKVISLSLWTVVVDYEGCVYCMYTKHIGEYFTWKEVIYNRMREHLIRLGVDNLQIKRMLRDVDIKKEGHLIETEYENGGNRIGIDGTDDIYVRKDRFTYAR